MRRNQTDVLRAQTLLSNDRLNTSGEFCEVLIKDLNKLLKEYFEYKGLPNLSLEKRGASVLVCINIEAINIKKFSALPND